MTRTLGGEATASPPRSLHSYAETTASTTRPLIASRIEWPPLGWRTRRVARAGRRQYDLGMIRAFTAEDEDDMIHL